MIEVDLDGVRKVFKNVTEEQMAENIRVGECDYIACNECHFLGDDGCNRENFKRAKIVHSATAPYLAEIDKKIEELNKLKQEVMRWNL